MTNRSRDIFINGFALFAMFLGAGNLIFPPFLGFYSGTNWLSSMMGFTITGVGLPLLGIYATLKSGGTVLTLGRHVGHRFAALMGMIIILAIGPFFAVPRTAATVHEVALMPLFPYLPTWLTSLGFFLVVLFFVFNESKALDRLGRFLTPFLIITLLIIIVTSLVIPVSEPAVLEKPFAFRSSFTEGYQTMDALASVMFAGVVLTQFITRGYTSRRDQLTLTLKCGILAAGLLFCVYGGLLYAGATASPEHASLGRTALLVAVTKDLLGFTGLICLSIAVALACLTTAIGLIVTCGEYFHSISNGRFSYRQIVIIATVTSWFISIHGVDTIIALAVPLLVTLYPIVMTLILFNSFDQFIPNKRAYQGAIAGTSLVALADGLATLKSQFALNWGWVDKIQELKTFLPLQQISLEWLLPALIGAVLACMLCSNPAVAPQEESLHSEA